MTDQHPITPPPELRARWEQDWHHAKVKHVELEDHIAIAAARWGADTELEACCEWLGPLGIKGGDALRATRRPKPLSQAEQALDALGPEPLPEPGPTGDTLLNAGAIEQHRLVCRALERLKELEENAS